MRRRFRAHAMQIGLAGLALGVVIVLAAVIFFEPGTAAAAPRMQGEKPSDETCLACHQQEGMTAQIGGQPVPITIDSTKFRCLGPWDGKYCLCGLPYEYYRFPPS